MSTWAVINIYEKPEDYPANKPMTVITVNSDGHLMAKWLYDHNYVNKKIVNGYYPNSDWHKYANGIQNLTAQLIYELCKDWGCMGHVYVSNTAYVDNAKYIHHIVPVENTSVLFVEVDKDVDE